MLKTSALILLSLVSRERYGLEIQNAIHAATGETVKVGTLYPTLARLEQGGLVLSRWGEGRGSEPRRRYYWLTVAGHAEIATIEDQIAILKGAK